MKSGTFRKSALVTALVSLSWQEYTFAQPDDLAIEEVFVTATRVEKSLQEVAVSVAVLDGQDLINAGAISFADIGFSVGNFVSNESANDPTIGVISIRGISGRAGVYVDDVIQGDGVSINTTLVDVERIEVLRGPQGTTFGANTIGGAVNTITSAPSFEFTGSADATAGSYGFMQYRGGVSGALIPDTLAGKISAFSREADGADEQIGTGRDVSGDDETGVRGGLLWTPTNDLSIRLDAAYSDLDIDNAFTFDFLGESAGSQLQNYQSGFFAQFGFDNEPFPANTSPTDRKVWETTEPNNVTRELTAYSAKVDWDLSDSMKLVSITAWQDIDSSRSVDEDRLPTYLAQTDSISNYEQFSQEFRLSGSTDRLDWLVGAFYLETEKNDDGLLRLSPLLLFTAAGLPGFLSGVGAAESNLTTTEVQDMALFGSVGYDITDKLNITAGLRYTDNELDRFEAISQGLIGGLVLNSQERAPVSELSAFQFPTINDDRWDPSVSATWSINDDMNVYVAASTGYQRARYNSRFVCENGSIVAESCEVDPEEATNFEIGFKSQWFDDRLRFNAVAYHLAYENLQRTQVVITEENPVGQAVTTNVDTTSEGLEIELNWLVNEWIRWDFNGGMMDASYDDSASNTNVPVSNEDGSGTVLVDARGEQLPQAPDYTLSSAITLDKPLFGNWNGLLRLEAQYRDEFNTNLGPNPALQVDSQTNVNFTLGMYQTGEAGLSVMLRGRNILDEQYFTNAAGFPTVGQSVPLSEPEWYYLEVRAFF